jgi:hypothetical protein
MYQAIKGVCDMDSRIRIFDGKVYRDMTPEEIVAREAERLESERRFWLDIPYDEAVNAEIRKRYSESQEFAILRQRDEKPEEYGQYYDYCESCKAYIKQKKEEYEWQ